jgi:hypothetical protein
MSERRDLALHLLAEMGKIELNLEGFKTKPVEVKRVLHKSLQGRLAEFLETALKYTIAVEKQINEGLEEGRGNGKGDAIADESQNKS